MNTLAARLKEVRGDIPQAEFAELVGINKSSWGRYERGETEPSGSDLINVCHLCNIATDWLLFGRGPMHPEGNPQPAKNAPEQPVSTLETAGCARCAKLEEKLERLEEERRELAQENRQLWKENGDLKAICAELKERQKHCCPDPLLRTPPPLALSSEADLRA